jgi:hypothetical protein
VLPAFGAAVALPLGLPLVRSLSFLIILLRWLTLPSERAIR